MRLASFGAICLAALLVACGYAPFQKADIQAAHWIAPGNDNVTALTTQPATCISANLKTVAAARGEALFNSPLLLGGQAAKAGISCASCHQNGRDNPSFILSGLTNIPGVVDVSHGLFSKVRADGADNPVAIPDLAKRAALKVDYVKEGELEEFLFLQITEEFQGAAPPQEVTSALAAYLRSLDDKICDAEAREPLLWENEIARMEIALSAVAESKSTSAKQAYRNAARSSLGRLHERFSQEVVRAQLIELSKDIQNDIAMDSRAKKIADLRVDLNRFEEQSYYDPSYLKRGL